MRKQIVIFLAIVISAFGYDIWGHVYLFSNTCSVGEVELYSDTTSRPIDSVCLTENGYQFNGLSSGTYWLFVRAARNEFGLEPWYKSEGFVMVVFESSPIHQHLYASIGTSYYGPCST